MHRFLLPLLLLLPADLRAGSTFDLQKGTVLELAAAHEAAVLLGRDDEYFRRMSPFDREVRMRVDEPPSRETFAAHVAANAVDWSEREEERMRGAVGRLGATLEPLELRFPTKITIVKTTGLEDVNFPYCRGALIVFPASALRDESTIARILAHELFHVFSTHHPKLRDSLYALLGFTHCGELPLPPELDKRRFTNPDAPRYDYSTRVQIGDRLASVVPALLARADHFDPQQKDGVLAQIDFRLIEVEPKQDGVVPVLEADGAVRSHLASEVPDYRRRVAQNTGYDWHPEEVLAENFVHLLLPPAKPLTNPELPQQLRAVMQTP